MKQGTVTGEVMGLALFVGGGAVIATMRPDLVYLALVFGLLAGFPLACLVERLLRRHAGFPRRAAPVRPVESDPWRYNYDAMRLAGFDDARARELVATAELPELRPPSNGSNAQRIQS